MTDKSVGIIKNTIKPFLVLSGLITCSTFILLVNPSSAMPLLFGLDYDDKYQIIIQHWSLMITMVGIMMIAAAFIHPLRVPVMIVAFVEKLALVALVLFYINSPATQGFLPAMFTDLTICILLVFYFLMLKLKNHR